MAPFFADQREDVISVLDAVHTRTPLRKATYPSSKPPTTENFQVDLRGIVEILSHNLYSSPRVCVRELI